MTVSNMITSARLMAVPLIVYLIVEGSYDWAFVLFVLAGASDAVDGTIAKWLRETSPVGRLLDPIADKALIVGVYVTLGLRGAIAEPVVIVVVLRDALILAGVGLFYLFHRPLVVQAAQVSRINTGLQVFLVTVVLADLAFAFGLPGLIEIIGYLVIATTVASGVVYLAAGLRGFNHAEPMP